eukprot:5175401-Ditylum_brightwellii.AAC.1
MTEYVGCKVDRDNTDGECGSLRFTQSAMIQSFEDEFDLPKGKAPVTAGEPGQILKRGYPDDEMSASGKKYYQKGTGKLLHMMRWSCPDIFNSVREISTFMSGNGAVPAHTVAMHRAMHFGVSTPEIGWTLRPDAKWD